MREISFFEYLGEERHRRDQLELAVTPQHGADASYVALSSAVGWPAVFAMERNREFAVSSAKAYPVFTSMA